MRIRGLGIALVLALPACGRSEAARVDVVAVRVLAHDTTWEAAYLAPFGDRGAREVATGREIHVPVGAEVRLALESRAFLCTFALPALGLRDFAAPGLPADLRFRVERAGDYELRSDEMCGLPHGDASRGRLVAEGADSFRSWVGRRAQEARR